MNEIEELRAQIQKLEDRSKGQEMALISLVHAMCDAGNIDLKRVSDGFSKISKAQKEKFQLGETAVPLDNISHVLAVSAEVVEEAQSQQR